MLNALAVLMWSVVDFLLVLTAKWLVPPISLGRWRGESLDGSEGRVHGPAGALSFQCDGQRVLTSKGLWLVGLAFYVLVGLAAAGVASLT
jgi:hypothetical protein